MKTLMNLKYLLIVLLTWVSFNAELLAQAKRQSTSLRVVSSKQTASVRSFQEDSIKYISVTDLAQLLQLQYFENTILKKAELRFKKAVLKFSAENSFVVQTNPVTNKNKVIQLSHAVLVEQGMYFAPAKEIVQLIKTLDDPLLSIEEDTTLVTPIIPTSSAVPMVTGFTIDEKTNGTLFRIHLTEKVRDFSGSKQNGEWLYVTLMGTQCDTLSVDTTFATGIVQRVKPVLSETSLQLSLQIRDTIEQSEIVQDQSSNDILLTLIPKVVPQEKLPVIDSAAIRKQQAESKRKATEVSIEKQKKKWKLDVVVIDAGHGGHDPGTIGLIGTREKDITLGIALKLGEMIQKELPDVKVVYTRKTDRFVELYRRGQIANENEGKLFISIHANSTERKPSSANGFEIYLLRPGKTEDAIRIAEKENDVVKLEKDYEDRYQELTEENFIILTMAQSSYVKQSERFAEMLEETMSAQMEGQRQPVKQAGFYVLVGASMPNVLVESGYLSNVKDERFLRSPAGQKKIAASLLNALKGYKIEYEGDF
ncbi:MAG: N-acetylmuramoyl-L-alanine amidase [Bacteroidota bacterium]|nr:N-acetylmuramoyl-L-alanine amidase [Bacteroidota bacterium]